MSRIKDEKDKQKEQEAFDTLRALVGHELEDGGIIESIEVTFTDHKTGAKRTVKI